MIFDPFWSIEQLSERFARRELSSVEAVTELVRRIAALDGRLHAFCQVDEDGALARARAADEARANGNSTSPLLGVPLAVKDIFDQAGHGTHAGSNALNDRLPIRSANAVEKLESAGMIAIGRTNMVEFAYGGWGTNQVQGAPCNPWGLDTHVVAGGSSSGSAVAVAGGFAPAALGTDTGGSIRTPAAWCGIVGLKTSVGLVGRGGVVPLCPTHDSVGPMTRTVRDAALLLEAMVGSDPRDVATWHVPSVRSLTTIEDGVKGLRIGMLHERDLAGVEPDIRMLHDRAIADLTALGAQFHKIALPLSISDYLGRGGDIMSVESYAFLSAYVEHPDSPVDPVIAERISRGRDISGPAYYRLLETRRLAQIGFQEAAAGFDAFVAPGSHRSPVPLGEVDESQPPNHFGRLVNYLDLASLVVPVGLTSNGLPAGLQIVVRKFDDALALRIGRTLERERGGLFVPAPGLLAQ
ncbi:Glu-tRNA(Gln) amidotransferase subunit A (plasmid) [Mesorhizobium loti]|uniref:Indoleacetamide hydrolase n=1 Tax=Mesorhizobium japonicum (strain LMG 29417 / CECT 9101 / MAFF 303099) TaxID=266835 RepID=Q982K9_RHILO|nr:MULTISPECIES: amidase [Mesorhizobium]BAB54447.1 Glu-tRNA(Gln) amidotransferase subunit A [Mesorhizobium japonicum MAFF 303099]BAV52754.1 Glu-tRNA(Gln) amidotransferase subunit A [Mesorhizobium loti]BCH04881.1 amidase [Mesorhizobium sp. 131-2-5]